MELVVVELVVVDTSEIVVVLESVNVVVELEVVELVVVESWSS